MAHPVPKGPLAARFRDLELPAIRAGALDKASIEVENAGTVAWRPDLKIQIAYHWLDDRGNPIDWDGIRTPLERVVEPGETLVQIAHARGPIPPGRYRLAVDLVEEHRFWVAELGVAAWEEAVVVEPRSGSPRVFGASPDEAWLAGARALHAEGFGAVGGAVEGLRDYPAGAGRVPRFARPLVCPSLLPPLEPNCEVEGLPAWRPEEEEPYMYDGRLALRLR
jgi:hypothetical protein